MVDLPKSTLPRDLSRKKLTFLPLSTLKKFANAKKSKKNTLKSFPRFFHFKIKLKFFNKVIIKKKNLILPYFSNRSIFNTLNWNFENS